MYSIPLRIVPKRRPQSIRASRWKHSRKARDLRTPKPRQLLVTSRSSNLAVRNPAIAAQQMQRTQIRTFALVPNPADANDKSKHIVVEVTSRSRRLYHLPSTATLKKQLLHKRVMITGWLLYDLMHESNAANTNPNGKKIWRATCEEIHPVSGIKVLH